VWPEGTEKECCSKGFAACEQDDTPDYDCEAAYPNWRTAWSAEKQGWCCAHYKRGCQEASYDCDASNDDLVSEWSVNKSSWCCEHQQLGCAAEVQTVDAESIDCSSGTPDTTTERSQAKKRWCCKYKDVGCHDLVAEAGVVAKYTQSSTSGLAPSPASELVRTWLVGVVLLAPVALSVRTLCRRRVDHLPVANQGALLNADVELE